jgi:hypothetical protein
MDWKLIKKELPKKEGPYLVFAKSKNPKIPFIYVAWYEPKFGWSLIPEVWVKSLTHWMPLPKPPK